MYFNWRYNTVGHLFQGRYKAFICDRDEYLLSLKYIHFNPVRAKISKTPDEYPWSSHRSHVGRDDENTVVDIDEVLMIFPKNKSKARNRYRAYMNDSRGLRKDDVYDSVREGILGSDEFIEKVMKRCPGIAIKPRRRKDYSLAEIAGGVKRRFGITLDQLRGENKSELVSLARKIMALVAEKHGHKRKEIAEFIGKDPAVVTRYLREMESPGVEAESVIKILSESRKSVNVKSQV